MGRPENVRITRADGTEVPCELFHGGLEEGVDTWVIANEFHPEAGDRVLIDVLPAHTALEMRAPDPTGQEG